MKNAMQVFVTAASLLLSTPLFAASPMPGAPVWHPYTCGPALRNGQHVIGGQVALSVATAAVPRQFSIRGCSYKTAPVVPNAVWRDEQLKLAQQDENVAEYAGKTFRITIDKADLSAVIQYQNGTKIKCLVRPHSTEKN